MSQKPVVQQRPITRKAVAKRNNEAKQNGRQTNGRVTIPIVTSQATKPVAKTATTTKTKNGKQAEPPSAEQPETAVLHYGDQTGVDMANQTEVQTYQRYLADKQTVPASKAILLTYFQQQSQAIAAP